MDNNNNNMISFLKNNNLDCYIIGHLNPDFDSIGSSFSILQILHKLNKNAYVLLDDNGKKLLEKCKKTEFFKYVKTEKEIDGNYVAILVDSSSIDRAGMFKDVYENASFKINIDHHNHNSIVANYKFVNEKASANCENIFNIFSPYNLIDKEIAEFLFMGIVTDTKCFSIPLDNQIFSIAHTLSSYGIKTNEIIRNVYLSKKISDVKVLDEAIKTLEKRNIHFVTLDMTKQPFKDLTHNQVGNIVTNNLTSYEGIDIVAVILAYEDKTVVEFRSTSEENNVDEIAVKLGGGGHKAASGCTVYIKPEEVKQIIDNYFENKFKEENYEL